MKIDDKKADEYFEIDYAEAIDDLKSLCTQKGVNYDTLTYQTKAVLIDMIFNMGRGGIDSSRGLGSFINMWAALKINDYELAARHVMDSSYGRGITCHRAKTNSDALRNQIIPV